jgi:hypothetical protein
MPYRSIEGESLADLLSANNSFQSNQVDRACHRYGIDKNILGQPAVPNPSWNSDMVFDKSTCYSHKWRYSDQAQY